jgi:hypothetical protein
MADSSDLSETTYALIDRLKKGAEDLRRTVTASREVLARSHELQTSNRAASAVMEESGAPFTGLRCPSCKRLVANVENIVAGGVLMMRCSGCDNRWTADEPLRPEHGQ